MPDIIEISHYIIISPGTKKYRPKLKLVSTLAGAMPANAVALKLNIQLPASIFNKPQLQATIKIKEEDLAKPVIDAQVLDNIKATFQQNFGIDMNIQVVDPK